MKIQVNADWYTGVSIHGTQTYIDKVPDICPICLNGCAPRHFSGWLEQGRLQKVFGCTRSDCQSLFIAYYNYAGDTKIQFENRIYEYVNIAPISIEKIEFSEIINKISPQFSEIYNEAKEAEIRELKNICGAGYRKAVEFLIKDYVIKVKEKPEDKIRNKSLGNCIKEDINERRIKQCVERAVWLGNDETHYYRIWETKDIGHLKKLIDLTLFWIESEHLTQEFEEEMPDKKDT